MSFHVIVISAGKVVECVELFYIVTKVYAAIYPVDVRISGGSGGGGGGALQDDDWLIAPAAPGGCVLHLLEGHVFRPSGLVCSSLQQWNEE